MHLTLRSGNEFSASDLANDLSLAADIAPVQIEAVTMVVHSRDRFAIELAEKNMRQGFGYRSGRTGEKVGNADVELTVSELDVAIGIRETAELQAQLRHRSTGTNFPKYPRIDLLRRFKKERCLQTFEWKRGADFQHLSLAYRGQGTAYRPAAILSYARSGVL